MTAKRLLTVLTSHEEMGISGKKTGNWFDEVATPYYKFREAGFGVTKRALSLQICKWNSCGLAQ